MENPQVGDRVRHGAMRGGVILKVIDDEHCEVRWPAYDSKMKSRGLKPDTDPDPNE